MLKHVITYSHTAFALMNAAKIKNSFVSYVFRLIKSAKRDMHTHALKHTQKEVSPAVSCQSNTRDLRSFAGLWVPPNDYVSVPGVKGIDSWAECASCSPDRLVDWLFSPTGRKHRQIKIHTYMSLHQSSWHSNTCTCQWESRCVRTCIICGSNYMGTQANTCCKLLDGMHASHTHTHTPLPPSKPQLLYSWAGSAVSCIIMAEILPLFLPLLAFLPGSAFVKCHVSADSVFWASMSIIRHTTLWKPVDPFAQDILIHF